jgi:beta-N-acetylglucosaminidase
LINKSYLNKFYLLLIIMCGLFILIPNTVMATTGISVNQMEHRMNVKADKVWEIKFNQGINEDKLKEKVLVFKPIGSKADVKISYDPINKIIKVEPPLGGYVPGQTYSLHIYDAITDLNSNPLKASVIMNFTIEVPDNGPRVNSDNREYNYEKYDITLDQIVDIQSKVNPLYVLPKYIVKPSNIDISAYLNPLNFENYDYALYQFLKLNYIEGITAETLNLYLKGNGVLENQGEAFLAAAKENNINVSYLTAHTILETGHGTSKFSTGILVDQVDGNPVESKITFNMFGIRATDYDTSKNGSEHAYKQGWFSVEAAIMGGAQFISENYINNDTLKQNTLYKMRWNPESTASMAGIATHQYASDIGWAYKISCIIKQIQDKDANANLVFEIPQYK